jgi:UDP-4-amino-4,6-dideoxy-N-acetyl-beta-L-altrosamine N-acetyltransferase
MKIELRNFILLNKNEHKKLLNIRNSDYVRFKMKTIRKIDFNDHLLFIKNLKECEEKKYYAVFVDNKIVGAVDITNINEKRKECSWGLYFDEKTIPYVSSLSTYLLIDRVFEYLKFEKLCLEVKKTNTSAYKLDLNFGFKVYDEFVCEDEEYYSMQIRKDNWQDFKQKPLMQMLKKKIDRVDYEFKEK